MRQSERKKAGEDPDFSFKVFFELMARRVGEILLVSSPYDAFIMEEDGRLAERIIHEYRGLNLTRPPRLTWKSTAREAMEALTEKTYDLVITMPRIDDMEPFAFGREVKKSFPDLPVFLLTHPTGKILSSPRIEDHSAIDRTFVWHGNTDLLLALIKSVEDRMNVAYDTQRALVRVIILVEDSPFYLSSLLPLLYKELVLQTQAVMEESLNEEHRILRMRGRPKILIAENYEEACRLYRKFEPFILCIFSDVRFRREGKMDHEAGFSLLSAIAQKSPHLPLLVFSSEEANRKGAEAIPAVFLNKNSPTLHTEIRNFLVQYLGFGPFIFKLPDETEVGRAPNILAMEKILPAIPDESIFFHASRNHFSTWLTARSEMQLAASLRPVKASDFSSTREMKEYLINYLRNRRRERQKGVVVDFVADEFDAETDYVKIGKGSLGGKARGLAFVWELLKGHAPLQEKYPQVNISVPRMLVLSTDGFDTFISQNDLKQCANTEMGDDEIRARFLAGHFPERLYQALEVYLEAVTHPIAVRSSSLFEDALYHPCAGIYSTFMLPNIHPDFRVRIAQLVYAIKLVYASTYLEAPRSFAQRSGHRIEEEKMGIIIQQLTGHHQGGYFYPAISGVAQSHNFYPIAYMKPREGIVHIALGLGKTVVEGGMALRFSPKYPQFLPQFSSVADMLTNSQRSFYSLKLTDDPAESIVADDGTLALLNIHDSGDHPAVQRLSSAYLPDDQRIRDSFQKDAQPVLTFASVLKYRLWPLPELLADLLDMSRKGLGCPVEIEFSFNLPLETSAKPEFAILQLRPMALGQIGTELEISSEDIESALCFSDNALGNGICEDISDIVFVDPDTFEPAHTLQMAGEIGKINSLLSRARRRYLLIGPGRWGSADRWLGIPVGWKDISGVGAMIEATAENLNADPSQGSHFFHNLISMGISYLTVPRRGRSFIDWEWLKSHPPENETRYIRHIKLKTPLSIKIDGKTTKAVIIKETREF